MKLKQLNRIEKGLRHLLSIPKEEKRNQLLQAEAAPATERKKVIQHQEKNLHNQDIQLQEVAAVVHHQDHPQLHQEAAAVEAVRETGEDNYESH